MVQVVKTMQAKSSSSGKAEVGEMGTNSGTPVKPFKHSPGQWSAGKPHSLAPTHMDNVAQPLIAAAIHTMGSSSMQIQPFTSTALERGRAKYGILSLIAME